MGTPRYYPTANTGTTTSLQRFGGANRNSSSVNVGFLFAKVRERSPFTVPSRHLGHFWILHFGSAFSHGEAPTFLETDLPTRHVN
jgi:hypothetical protein